MREEQTDFSNIMPIGSRATLTFHIDATMLTVTKYINTFLSSKLKKYQIHNISRYTSNEQIAEK
jgi:hypothetical protein